MFDMISGYHQIRMATVHGQYRTDSHDNPNVLVRIHLYALIWIVLSAGYFHQINGKSH